MTITSPCINVCVTDPDTDFCYGCSRTTKEIKEWSKYNDDEQLEVIKISRNRICLLYTSPSPRDLSTSRMPSSA